MRETSISKIKTERDDQKYVKKGKNSITTIDKEEKAPLQHFPNLGLMARFLRCILEDIFNHIMNLYFFPPISPPSHRTVFGGGGMYIPILREIISC